MQALLKAAAQPAPHVKSLHALVCPCEWMGQILAACQVLDLSKEAIIHSRATMSSRAVVVTWLPVVLGLGGVLGSSRCGGSSQSKAGDDVSWPWAKSSNTLDPAGKSCNHVRTRTDSQCDISIVSIKPALAEKVRSNKSKEVELHLRSSEFVQKHSIDEETIKSAIDLHEHKINNVVVIDALDREQYIDMSGNKANKQKHGQSYDF